MKKNILFIAMLLFIGGRAIAKAGSYIEFKITGSQISGAVKTYSCDGNNRTEVKMTIPGSTAPMVSVSLLLKSNPDTTYVLNVKDKMYSESKTGKDDQNHKYGNYEITIVGKEKIGNYNCTHIKLHRDGDKTEREMWLSKDIAGWKTYTATKNSFFERLNIETDQKTKGAEGYPVRISIHEATGDLMQIDFVKAEKKDLSEYLFSLKGYKKPKSQLQTRSFVNPVTEQ